MSFIQDLADKQRKNAAVSPQIDGIPINLPGAQEGLAGNYRDPYRVNGPISSEVAPAVRSRMQLLPQPLQNYRG